MKFARSSTTPAHQMAQESQSKLSGAAGAFRPAADQYHPSRAAEVPNRTAAGNQASRVRQAHRSREAGAPSELTSAMAAVRKLRPPRNRKAQTDHRTGQQTMATATTMQISRKPVQSTSAS